LKICSPLRFFWKGKPNFFFFKDSNKSLEINKIFCSWRTYRFYLDMHHFVSLSTIFFRPQISIRLSKSIIYSFKQSQWISNVHTFSSYCLTPNYSFIFPYSSTSNIGLNFFQLLNCWIIEIQTIQSWPCQQSGNNIILVQ